MPQSVRIAAKRLKVPSVGEQLIKSTKWWGQFWVLEAKEKLYSGGRETVLSIYGKEIC